MRYSIYVYAYYIMYACITEFYKVQVYFSCASIKTYCVDELMFTLTLFALCNIRAAENDRINKIARVIIKLLIFLYYLVVGIIRNIQSNEKYVYCIPMYKIKKQQ